MKPLIDLLIPAFNREALPSNALCLLDDDGPWLCVCHSREQALDLIGQSRNSAKSKAGMRSLLDLSCMPMSCAEEIKKLGGAEAAEIAAVVSEAARRRDRPHLPERATHGLYMRITDESGHAFFGALTPQGCRFHVVHAREELWELLKRHRVEAKEMGLYVSAQRQILASALPETSQRPSWVVEGNAALLITAILMERMNARRARTN